MEYNRQINQYIDRSIQSTFIYQSQSNYLFKQIKREREKERERKREEERKKEREKRKKEREKRKTEREFYISVYNNESF